MGDRVQGNALDWMEAAFDVSYDEDEGIYRCGCPDVNVETIKTIPQQALFVDRDQSDVPENSVFVLLWDGETFLFDAASKNQGDGVCP
jgi:hypothetical protein